MKQQPSSSPTTTLSRPPIVTVLGHVDHGKTTLLDTIRKTNVTAKEHGGITQHIGAYQVEVKGKKITFIDTPGHEAFRNMRSRGAHVADVAILVVAVNDGIQPQTKESIRIIKEAKIPYVVAINKMDMPAAKPDRIKKQLIKEGVTLEEYGGETPIIPISAKEGMGIDKLLDMIHLLYELSEKPKPTSLLEAVVIESSVSKQTGATATIIVKNGTLAAKETVVCDNQEFRIRALFDWKGNTLQHVSSGEPVLVLGWTRTPNVGSIVYAKKDTEMANPPHREIAAWKQPRLPTIPPQHAIEEEHLKVILRADTVGTLEAITEGLKEDIRVLSSNVGALTESDVLLAKTTGAIIIGFNVEAPDQVIQLGKSEKVFIKTYTIIYELFQEVEDVATALKQGNLVTVLGEAKVLALFPFDKEIVAGVKVVSGRIARGDQVKIVRDGKEFARSRIKSLRHGKEDTTKAEAGAEAGALLAQNLDLLTGDSIISIG